MTRPTKSSVASMWPKYRHGAAPFILMRDLRSVGSNGLDVLRLLPLGLHGDSVGPGRHATTSGFAFTSLGLGGVIGGLALASVMDGTSRSHIIMGLVLAAALTAVALSPTLWLGYLFLFLFGAASVSFKSSAASTLQLGSEPDMRGRIVALYFLALAGTSPVGGPLQGWISEFSHHEPA